MEYVDALSTVLVADSPGRRGEYVDVRQLPAQWAKLAESRGIAGSANALALKAGIATTTLTRLVFGESSSPATIRKVADALGVSQERVRSLAGIPTPLGVWVPPEQANQMDRQTREALDALILAITRKGDGTDAHHADAPKKTHKAVLETAEAIPLSRQETPPTDGAPDPRSTVGQNGQGSRR